MSIEMGRTPSFSEVLARTHTRKKDRDEWWTSGHKTARYEAFEAEKSRLEAEPPERQAIIDTGGPEPPPIYEKVIWLRIACGRKKGRIYDKGVVPVYSIPLIIGDVDDNDTAFGPPDVKEQKVRTLETALESQSQEVSELRKAYSDMYSFLELTQSGNSGSASFTAIPPPPPPRPPRDRSPSPPPQLDRAASPSH
ncbi:hypothetical protein PIB30_067048 [Stylosanthes scabra]|uniref:Uncharacterized protein n=1 Tax=Stylosanthes scabra TaxID=79078 RepID=A0ABU6TM95_9FABA|nr:hypothetical protein [Stylosanthes scabra]